MKRATTIFLWTLTIWVSVLSAQGHADYSPHGIAVTSNGAYVYVVNTGDNSVSVIDTSTDAAIRGISVGNAPWDIVISPDDQYAYVTDASDDTVSVIDIPDHSVSRTISLESGKTPRGIAMVNGYLYVANETGNSISIVEVASDQVSEKTLGFSAVDVAGEDGGDGNDYVYIAMPRVSSLFFAYRVQGDGSLTVDGNFTIQDSSSGVAIKPGSRYAYVANTGSNTVSVINTADVFSTVTYISVGASPNGVAVSSDGTRVYVANTDDGSVSVIDSDAASATYNQVTDTITGLGIGSYGIVSYNPVYVSNSGDDTVSIIDTAANAVIGSVDVAPSSFDPSSDSTSDTGGSGGGGGGCSLNKNADFSPELLILLFVSVVYLFRRKKREGHLK